MHVKIVLAPSYLLLTVPRRLLCCGSPLPVFCVRVSVTFHLMCVHIIFSSVRLLSGHLLGNSCSLSVDHMTCSLCILTICNKFINYFPFWFWAGFGSDCFSS